MLRTKGNGFQRLCIIIHAYLSVSGAELAGVDNDGPDNVGLQIDELDFGGRVLRVRTKKHAQLLLPYPCSKGGD